MKIRVEDYRDVRTTFSLPEYINRFDIFYIQDDETQVRIQPLEVKRDNKGRISFVFDESVIGRVLDVRLLWARIIDRGDDEIASSYLSRMLFHLDSFRKGISTQSLSSQGILGLGEFKVVNMPIGIWSLNNSNFDFKNKGYFKYLHDILFYTTATGVLISNLESISLKDRVVFIYYGHGIFKEKFLFSVEPLEVKETVLVEDRLNLYAALLPRRDNVTLRYV